MLRGGGDDGDSVFKHGPFAIGHCKIGFRDHYDCTRGTDLAKRDLVNLQTNSASLVGIAFASTHFWLNKSTASQRMYLLPVDDGESAP
ncbi:hypothetical protein Tco_1056990 [Tanacetum coccineum]|uniref:Uncharacterized protein n=1 Tax=Tanacetum coccineum TaxID=301880 RepID=A0ABQ5H472_9ASTR